MGEVQLWQDDGLGTDKETLERVLHVFASDGVQGINSQHALNAYIQRLSDSKLREMYEISKETTLQILADCSGVAFAAGKYSKWQNDTYRKAIDILIKEKETAEQEAEVNRAELLNVQKKLNEEKDRILSDYTRAAQKAEDAEEKIISLQEELVHCKADLYDFYAQEGKVPNYG